MVKGAAQSRALRSWQGWKGALELFSATLRDNRAVSWIGDGVENKLEQTLQHGHGEARMTMFEVDMSRH